MQNQLLMRNAVISPRYPHNYLVAIIVLMTHSWRHVLTDLHQLVRIVVQVSPARLRNQTQHTVIGVISHSQLVPVIVSIYWIRIDRFATIHVQFSPDSRFHIL